MAFFLFLFVFLPLLSLLPSPLMSRLISHVKWVEVFVVAAVGEPCLFFITSLVRRHKGSRDLKLQASVMQAGMSVSYQEDLLHDGTVFLQMCAYQMNHFSFYFFHLEHDGEIEVLQLIRTVLFFFCDLAVYLSYGLKCIQRICLSLRYIHG